MRRLAQCLVAVLTIAFVAETRLSRGDRRPSEPPGPELWENAEPPGRSSPSPVVTRSERGLRVTYPSPSTNCATVISTDPTSLFAFSAVDRGVQFDIDDDGDLDQVAWTEPGSDVAFLALDRDGNGRITTGGELVGDHTVPGVVSGPTALIQLAAHAGHWATLDGRNPLFARLLLWRDANHNGTSEPAELRPVEDELSSIGLGYLRHSRMDGHGNQSRFRGFAFVRTAPGSNIAVAPEDERARFRHMYDVCLLTQ